MKRRTALQTLCGDDPSVLSRLMMSHVAAARKRERWSITEFDEICRIVDPSFPSCKDYENDPAHMTSKVFSVAASALALPCDLILHEMQMTKSREQDLLKLAQDDGVQIAASGEGAIDPVDAAKAYAFIRALDEMEEQGL